MRDRPDELIHPRPDGGGSADDAGGGAGGGPQHPLPLDAAEDDPDAGRTASLPGYGAGGAGDGEAAVGPPSQDHGRPG